MNSEWNEGLSLLEVERHRCGEKPLQIGAVAIHQKEEAKNYYNLMHVERFPSIFMDTSMLLSSGDGRGFPTSALTVAYWEIMVAAFQY